MASIRSRVNSTTSSRLSKSPSLQNVYTAGVSARNERGVFMKSSLSRTHSTCDLRPRPNFAALERGRSERRSTLSVPCRAMSQNATEKERCGTGVNTPTNNQDRSFRGHSQRVGVKPALSLKRQVFERNFDRPPCLSAPVSPRNSADSLHFVYSPSSSAPSSPKGSVGSIDASLRSSGTALVFKVPETNPFHEEYKKRWGSASLDTAYGIYSSNLNNNVIVPGKPDEMVATNNPVVYGIYNSGTRENIYGVIPCSNDGTVDSKQQSTCQHASALYSPGLRENGTVSDKSDMPLNSEQVNTYPTTVPGQGYQTRYSVDVNPSNSAMCHVSRNSPNDTCTVRPYFRSSCQPTDISSKVHLLQEQPVQESMRNGNAESHSGIYFSNSQLSPVNNFNNFAAGERSNDCLNTLDQQDQLQANSQRQSSVNLNTTGGIQCLKSQNPTSNDPWSISSSSKPQYDSNSSLINGQNRRGSSLAIATSDGGYSSFFQENQNDLVSTERRDSKETAAMLFQKHFRSRRGSIENGGKVSSMSRNDGTNQSRSFVNEYNQAPVVLQEQSPGMNAFIAKDNLIQRGVTTVQSGHLSNEYGVAIRGQEAAQVQQDCVKFEMNIEDHSSLGTAAKEEVMSEFPKSRNTMTDNCSQLRQERQNNCSEAYSTSLPVASNNLALPSGSAACQRRNSRSPEPVVAIHPSSLKVPPNNQNSSGISDEVNVLNSFQKHSLRRRSSTDVASLSSLPVSTNSSETPARKTSLTRSVSHSNLGQSLGGSRSDLTKSGGQASCRRSLGLRRIPSFEEFRTMRALNKMAYGEANGDGIANQKDENNNFSFEKNDGKRSESCSVGNNKNSNNNNSSSSSNNNNNNNNSNDNEHNGRVETTSSTNNPVIQDLLVKYGLDKTPSSFKVNRDSTKLAARSPREASCPTSPAQSPSSPADTKQRLLNILDDFLAVRTKQRSLSTSASMNNIFDSSRDQQRPNLPRGTSAKDDQSKNVKSTFSDSNKSNEISCVDTQKLSSRKSEIINTEESRSPCLAISSSNSRDIVEKRNRKDTSNESKTQTSSKGSDKGNNPVSPRRRSKKADKEKRYSSVVELYGNKARSPCEETVKTKVNDPDVSSVTDQFENSPSPEVKPKEREVTRRVSDKARNMARRHRESLEVVKKAGQKARKDRRESFTRALQNKNKESSAGQDECIPQETGTDDVQRAVKSSGPVKGDHSVEVESAGIEEKGARYLKLMHRRTSSLLSLTDDLLGDFDEFDAGDGFPDRSESLSELNEVSENLNRPVSRDSSFLSVKSDTDFPRGRQCSRTESSSSLLSRGSSFHSNYSADSGSVHLDFEDSDEDNDDCFCPAEPRQSHAKPESEIQRNDSGLGDEIGVGTRVKKRWEDLGHVSSRPSTIGSSWRESAPKKDERSEESQEQERRKIGQERQQEHGQQQQRRKISGIRRISKERQPNALDCPDCGRAFVVENDRPSVESVGPKKTLICYKCQSDRVERKEAIIELVQTEVNYGNDFKIIKEEFLSPMQTGGIVSPDNLAKIFLNIQELLDVSTKFCKRIENSMEECIGQHDEELCHMNVGKIFVENVELLQAYELYCSRQPEAITLLESLQKKNDVLRVFLNITCRENQRCRKMDINSFLMAPVQRVTKYPLLLSRIRRATPRWHGDREDLKLAQRKVEEQIAKINSLTKSSEMKAKKFQSNLGTSDAVDSSRLKKLACDVLAWTFDEIQLLMHGQLKVLCTDFGGGQSWTKRAMKRSVETRVLFCIRGQNEPINVDSEDDDCLQFPAASEISDASLLLLKRKNNGKYTLFRDEIKLRDCVVYEETDPDSFGLVHMGRESFSFTARTTKDARKWVKYLKLQTKDQGKWRRRRNASANIMLQTS